VLPLAGSLEETDHVIGHELVHAFQYDITGNDGRMNSRLSPGIAFLPLWFTEGMAEYISKGPIDPLTAMWMRIAVETRFPQSFGEIDHSRYFPYRFGQAFLAYIGGRAGDQSIVRLMLAGGRWRNLRAAFDSVLGTDADSLVQRWQADLRAAYAPAKATSTGPTEAGWARLAQSDDRRTMNLAPVLSPDGSSLIHLSTRDLFSIDLYHADLATGQIRKRLTNTAIDPHFESLQFISSAGAWGPAPQGLAVPVEPAAGILAGHSALGDSVRVDAP